jgi:cytoskeletal protein RodZ
MTHGHEPGREPGDDAGTAREAGSEAPSKRRRVWPIVAGAVAAAVIVAGIVVAAIHGATPQPGKGVANALDPVSTQLTRPSDTPVATPSAGATDAPATAAPAPSKPGTLDARYGGVVASTAEVAQNVKTPGGLTANVTAVEAYTATARRPGEVSGPAVKVTLKLVNDTGSDFPLSTATVNAYYGSASTPASPVEGDSASKPFTGTLKAGATATAVYVFSVPSADSGDVTLTLSDQAGAQLVVFR